MASINVDPNLKGDGRLYTQEDDMLQALQLHVKGLKLQGVPSPNYNDTGVYSSQWKAQGAVYLYKLADKIYAVALRGGKVYIFDPKANIEVDDNAGYGNQITVSKHHNAIRVAGS